jgi:hypothetical protein
MTRRYRLVLPEDSQLPKHRPRCLVCETDQFRLVLDEAGSAVGGA